jgi:hypothetical protein
MKLGLNDIRRDSYRSIMIYCMIKYDQTIIPGSNDVKRFVDEKGDNRI